MDTPYQDTFAFEALAVAGTAVGFTAATFATAYAAVARVEGAQVRYRTDGTDPTATVGMVADPGDVIYVNSSRDLQAIKFIRTGSSATVNAEFIR
jgi:hypothetical protein